MPHRMDRVNVLLREEISRVLSQELSDPRLSSVTSVTFVDASSDLRHAKVYISVLGSDDEKSSTIAGLQSASGFIHREIRRNLSLRNIPSLSFELDESIEKGNELLDKIKEYAPLPDTDDRNEIEL